MTRLPRPSSSHTIASRRAGNRVRFVSFSALLGAFSLFACDSSSDDPKGSGGDGDASVGAGAGVGDGDATSGGSGNGASGGDGDLVVPGSGGGDGDMSGMGGGAPVCDSTSSEAELAPIFLAFAFDVSGSMGKYDQPNWWHDPDAKWTPVRTATAAFFEDTSSIGISASMAFFPKSDNSCEEQSYESPDVAMTDLPSSDFSLAFDGYETEVGSPLAGGDWRGGTPTLHAFLGTSTYLGTFQTQNPEAKVAVVLVTDGLPQGCGGSDDEVSSVSAAVANLYNAGAGVRTYVIGIENPTTPPATLPALSDWNEWGCGASGDEPCMPPATLADLHDVAAAGGTTEAFLIDTGDPAATQAAFRQAIDAIRSQAISCELGIPPNPNGGTFDADKIDVTYTVDAQTTRLNYDPLCEATSAWHYDSEVDPSNIELCPDTCALIQSLPGAKLDVAFLCEDRIDVVK